MTLPLDAVGGSGTDDNLSDIPRSRNLGPRFFLQTLRSFEGHALSQEQREDLALLEYTLRGRAKENLLWFCEATHPNFIVGEHHRIICDALERVERGEIDRLMIFAPPRHGKSEIVSLRFPAWYLGKHPDHQVITVSYSDELAGDFGRKVRNLIADDEYKRYFEGIELAADSKAAGRWHTNKGGSYVSTGILGSVTGRGANILIVDDPFKNREEADSERIRDKVASVYQSDLQSRLMPGGAIVIMHTRWHEMDLAGRLLEAQATGGDKWHVISLPAIIDEHTPNERALWPDWFSLDEMKRRRENTDPRTWIALYQQAPQAEQGTFFQRDWFERYKFGDEPKEIAIYCTADFAVTDGDGDYTEIGVWGVDSEGRLFALAWWYGQTTSDVWIEKLIDMFERYRPYAFFGEGGVIRRAIEPMLIRRMRERKTFCRLEWLTSITDKPTRARGLQARASMRTVLIPSCSWGDRFIDQCVRFPAGRNDDAVDTGSLITRALDQAHPAVVRSAPTTAKRDRWTRAFMRARDQADALGWKVV